MAFYTVYIYWTRHILLWNKIDYKWYASKIDRGKLVFVLDYYLYADTQDKRARFSTAALLFVCSLDNERFTIRNQKKRDSEKESINEYWKQFFHFIFLSCSKIKFNFKKEISTHNRTYVRTLLLMLLIFFFSLLYHSVIRSKKRRLYTCKTWW